MNQNIPPKNGFAVFKRLIISASPYWVLFLIGMLGTIANSGIDAALAWTLKPVINKGFVARDVHFISILPAAIIIVFLLRGISGFLSDYCITRVGRNVVMQFRQDVFRAFVTYASLFL